MAAYETGVLTAQSVGAEPGSVKVSPCINFVDTGQEPPTRPDYVIATVPISAGENSYEVYFKLPIDPGTLTVSAFRVYLTSALPTGVTLKYKADWTGGTSAYATPTRVTSTVATTTIPTSLPGTANVTIDESLATTKTVPFLTDYIVMQLQTTTSAAEGAGALSLYVQYLDSSANTYTGIIPITYNVSKSSSSGIYYDVSGIYNDYIDVTGQFPDEGSDG